MPACVLSTSFVLLLFTSFNTFFPSLYREQNFPAMKDVTDPSMGTARAAWQ